MLILANELRVQATQFDSRISGRELPIDLGGANIAITLPSGNLVRQALPVVDPSRQALPSEDTQFALGDEGLLATVAARLFRPKSATELNTRSNHLFREFSKLAFPVALTGIIMASMADGVGVLIPLASMGGVIYVLFHSAKGFERADRKRRDRY